MFTFHRCKKMDFASWMNVKYLKLSHRSHSQVSERVPHLQQDLQAAAFPSSMFTKALPQYNTLASRLKDISDEVQVGGEWTKSNNGNLKYVYEKYCTCLKEFTGLNLWSENRIYPQSATIFHGIYIKTMQLQFRGIQSCHMTLLFQQPAVHNIITAFKYKYVYFRTFPHLPSILCWNNS